MTSKRRPSGVKTTRNTAARLERLVQVCESLPDAQTTNLGRRGEHRSFVVRKKIFAYYLFDHHGDGRIALWCKAGPGEQGRLVEEDPRRFFVPAYLGPRGWIGVRLDLGSVDWAGIAYLVGNAYRMTASRAQIARMESAGG
jgi:predicted DNA-binding protein (MmcQ/YjbR family)